VLTNQCGVRQLNKQTGGTLSLDFLTTAPWVTLNGTVSSGVTIECESVPATIPTCTTDEWYWTIVGVLSPEEVNVTVSGSGVSYSNRTANLPDPEVLAFEMNCTTPQTVQLNADYYNSTGDFSTLTPYKTFDVSRISSPPCRAESRRFRPRSVHVPTVATFRLTYYSFSVRSIRRPRRFRHRPDRVHNDASVLEDLGRLGRDLAQLYPVLMRRSGTPASPHATLSSYCMYCTNIVCTVSISIYRPLPML
jgi:hypothetical protein